LAIAVIHTRAATSATIMAAVPGRKSGLQEAQAPFRMTSTRVIH